MLWVLVQCCCADFVPAERCSHGAEEAVHQGGDGQSPDGKEPVQGEADGAPGGHQMDRDDSVRQEDTSVQCRVCQWRHSVGAAETSAVFRLIQLNRKHFSWENENKQKKKSVIFTLSCSGAQNTQQCYIHIGMTSIISYFRTTNLST